MSGGHKSIDKATGRTVWDKDHFEKKAKETQQKEEEDMAKLDADINAILNDKKKEKIAPPPEERRNLTHRDYDLKLDKQLGKTQVITAHTPKQFQGGYWCDTCECLLKDSLAWLDHINGKKHNRLLGYRMNVDRVGANQVRDKLKSLSKGQEEVQEEEDPEEKLRAMREAEEEKKRRRAEKKRKKKEEAEGASSSKAKRTHFDEEEEEEEEGGQAELDAETAKLMKEMGLPTNF
uniref:U1-type domain-containing protein n=1 Tax=Chromera velia CCMP2878 TaxID=1169474 RepID=A0A0G4H1M7_9ALVE|eukprot:Cvel_801.t1-p1 / transcript=Cvel_801.t1 / gene=Cvel_801 / organism=Chromera_velia_CCMP2878 / gene_product=Zinc finger matrin-type protein 2, putative / transcript_product=Zinc finger matrin-type protein 2, putative / location=Cvel_scaffold25:41316-42014(-) / protein_length=233 / sequence_SO=supercontig / SO=protein_coding / is_pseudo=false